MGPPSGPETAGPALGEAGVRGDNHSYLALSPRSQTTRGTTSPILRSLVSVHAPLCSGWLTARSPFSGKHRKCVRTNLNDKQYFNACLNALEVTMKIP